MVNMGSAWLIFAGTEPNASGARFDLKAGLTVLGGPRPDVAVAGSGNDCVHLWSSPPKLIYVGADDPPRVNGQPATELSLHFGDRLEWRGLVATFGCEPAHERLEEIPAHWENPAQAANAPAVQGGSSAPSGLSAWPLVKAGLAAELALGDADAIKRWQDAASRGEFDAQAASREILATTSGLGDDDPRLKDRCLRLMRDLLMAPVTKRQPRQATKNSFGCLAILVTQVLTVLLITLIVIAALLVARTRYGQSIDALLDRVLKLG
jgi:hypothetical protein